MTPSFNRCRHTAPALRTRSMAIVVLCLSPALAAPSLATEVNVSWTNNGGDNSWSNPNNWNPVLALPPYNEIIAGFQFNADIPNASCGGTVDFDNNAGIPTPNPTHILDLALDAGCELDIEVDTHLIVCPSSASSPECDRAGTFTNRGTLYGTGGDFTADHHSLPGAAQRYLAESGSAVSIGAQTPPQTYDFSGAGLNLNVILADGMGTSLVLHDAQEISTAFNDSSSTERYQQVLSSNLASLSLPQLLKTIPPARGEDVLYVTVDGAALDLPKLNWISGPGGITRVRTTEATLDLPQLETIEDVQFLLDYGVAGNNGIINLVHDPGFGPATMTTFGGPLNANIIDAPKSGSVFNAPGLGALDTGWSDSSSTVRLQRVNASDGGSVILSGLVSVDPPARGEDYVTFDCVSGSMNLDALETVSAGGGWTRFFLDDCTVALPSLLVSGDLAPLLRNGGLLDISGPADVTYDGRGLPLNGNVIDVDGPGSELRGTAYTAIDDGWNDSSSTSRSHQVIATNDGFVDLSSVESLTLPARSEDRTHFTCNTGGEIALDSLSTLSGGGQLLFSLDACTQTVGDMQYTERTDVQVSNGGQFSVLEDLRPRAATDVDIDQSSLTVGLDLQLVRASSTLGVPAVTLTTSDASIRVGRIFQHDQTDESRIVLGDSIVTLDGSGGAPFQTVEAGGLDFGAAGCPLLADDNFGFGQLVVGEPGASTTARMYEIYDNGNRGGGGGPEALYLFGGGTGDRCNRPSDGLVIESGSALELNCVDVYAWDASATQFVHLNSLFTGCDDPSEVAMFGGTIRMLPEPGAVGSLFAGVLALAGLGARRSRRRR